MPKGMQGFQPGNKLAQRSKLFEHEIRKALKAAAVEGTDKLRQIAERLIDLCIKGEDTVAIQAIRELADRLDGRPQQTIQANVEHTVETGDAAILAERLEAARRARSGPTVQ